MFFGLGSGIGWTIAITALAGLKEKVKMQSVPNGLRGPGITIIIVGIMALAFLGFSGILPIG
jgi:Na+-transporting NADH:ubiquinone oxidoreductase subunit E